jgi:hypothetical protein
VDHTLVDTEAVLVEHKLIKKAMKSSLKRGFDFLASEMLALNP